MKIRHKEVLPKCQILELLPIKFIVVLLFAAVFAGCASTPPSPPPAPPPEAPAQTDESAFKDRADKARQMGVDFHASGYFQSEWDSAEALYNQGKYGDAAPLYEAVANKAAVQFMEDQGNELLKARERALEVGAEEFAGDFLLMADNKAAEAEKLNDAKDYYAAKDATFLARDMYESLETGLKAGHMRIELDEWGFVAYDPDRIEAIDDIGYSGIDDYEAANIAAARRKFEDALEQYTQYRHEWMDVYAADIRDSTIDARQHALDLRANVAVRYDYDAANSIYDRAQSSYNEGDFEGAANLYHRSFTMFETLSNVTEQKRLIAEEAIRQAELRMAESDQTAQKAEQILEGGLQ